MSEVAYASSSIIPLTVVNYTYNNDMLSSDIDVVQ